MCGFSQKFSSQICSFKLFLKFYKNFQFFLNFYKKFQFFNFFYKGQIVDEPSYPDKPVEAIKLACDRAEKKWMNSSFGKGIKNMDRSGSCGLALLVKGFYFMFFLFGSDFSGLFLTFCFALGLNTE